MATQNSSGLVSTVYKSRKIILELMEKQNYNIDEYENFSVNEVNSMLQNKQLDMLMEKKGGPNNQKEKQDLYSVLFSQDIESSKYSRNY